MMKSQALQLIAECVSKCTLCPDLTDYRTARHYKTVPGAGSPVAKLMIVGEGPGESEAYEGLPFVGPAGKLLGRILQSLGLTREQVFIANIVRCRPPGNRVPTADEAGNCRRFLDLQIECIKPEWILCLGKTASAYLLGKPEDVYMGDLRGVHSYRGMNVVCTYHPAYVLRNASAADDVWHDIQPLVQWLQNQDPAD